MSDVQLARKRAADRAAQRALRQRTRERIQGLEARLKQLEATGSGDAVWESLKQRNIQLEEEIKQLKIAQQQNKESVRVETRLLTSTCEPTFVII